MRLMEGIEVIKTPRIEAALAELQQLIAERYPTATFRDFVGDEPIGFYLEATVDVESIFEVFDVYRNRYLDLYIEDDLPIYVNVRRTPERQAIVEREELAARASAETPVG